MDTKDIRKKVQELQNLAHQKQVDIHDDLSRIHAKLHTGETSTISPWERVELARHQDRPNTLEYIQKIGDNFIELHGDRKFKDDPALVGGIVQINKINFTFIGHQKGRTMKENLQRNYGWAHPEGYRKALRLAQQAEKFHRPIISFIDTAGAYPGIGSEERGISEAIAVNLKLFSVLRIPIIAIIIGEGGSGGALGIGIADRLFMLSNSTYSVISPEGFASILLRDAKKQQLAAELMKMTAPDLISFGIIDGIIEEPKGGAHLDPDICASQIKAYILKSYKELRDKKPEQLIMERSEKLLSLGVFSEDTPEQQFNWPFKRFLRKNKT